MELTILRRVAASTAVVAAAATLTAVPALTSATAHASAPTRADSSLSIRAVKAAVAPGRPSAVKGRLATPGADPAGRTLLLEARSEGTGGFIPVGTATTGAAGVVRLKVTPETTTFYRWRYSGSADADRARSGITRVRVRVPHGTAHRARTTLSIGLKDVGSRTVVRGKLFSRGTRVGRRWVVLVSRAAGAREWSFASAARTDHRGRVVYGVQPQLRTAYRLAFLGSPRLRPSRSGRVVVRTPSEASISALPGVIDPGASATVSGVVTAAGAVVPDATVRLVARKMRAGASWHGVQTATTAADGSVSFSVTPTRSTAYRLRVVRGAGIRPTTSPKAKVRVRARSSLSIRGRAGAPGYIVEGQLRAGGVVRAGRTVTLQSIAPGTTDWAVVASGTTNRNGHVELVQTLVAGTQYRLAYDGEELFLPSTSGTVVS